jgi:hypothetical protein
MIIGIDPGATGAACFIHAPGYTTLYDFKNITLAELWTLFRLQSLAPDVHAFIELVHGFPRQGAKANFSFGQRRGELEMALTALRIPFERVSPQAWQAELKLAGKCVSKAARKKKHYARAQELFPALGSQITISNCDALLIAEYGARKMRERS